jgi:hypothetical protein
LGDLAKENLPMGMASGMDNTDLGLLATLMEMSHTPQLRSEVSLIQIDLSLLPAFFADSETYK